MKVSPVGGFPGASTCSDVLCVDFSIIFSAPAARSLKLLPLAGNDFI